MTAAAFEALEKVRPELYTPLREYLFARAWREQNANLEAIAKLGDRGRPAAGVLLRILEGSTSQTIKGAEGFRESVGDLLRTLEEIGARDTSTLAVVKLAASAKVPDLTIRRSALGFLKRWAEEDTSRRKDVVAATAAGLDSTNADFVCECLQSLREYGTDAVPALPAVKRLKLAKDAAVRAAATDAAERIERKP